MQRLSVTQLELQFHEIVQRLKEYALVAYTYFSALYGTLQEVFISLWKYEEFRLGVYIFAILSVVPIVLFLVFSVIVILITTVLLSVVWAVCILTAVGLSLLFLIPMLTVCILTASLAAAVYFLCRYVTQSKQSSKPKYNLHDGEVYAKEK